MELSELSDRMEIEQVIYRYCRGIDRGDREMIRSVYHPDARDDHGTFKGAGIEFADLIVDSMDQQTMAAQHHITNIYIELHGNRAHVESYFLAFHPTGTGSAETLARMGGRYLDLFEKREGKWLIADRKVVSDWTRTSMSGDTWNIAAHFPAGARREADLSYTMFS